MNYEKKYKEALERARYYHSKDYMLINSAIENIFPELRKSEDERIRKELIEQVAYIIPNDDEVDSEGNALPAYQKRIDKYRAWLEKQGEKLDADEVIEWLNNQACQGWIEDVEVDKFVDKFKKDFGLC